VCESSCVPSPGGEDVKETGGKEEEGKRRHVHHHPFLRHRGGGRERGEEVSAPHLAVILRRPIAPILGGRGEPRGAHPPISSSPRNSKGGKTKVNGTEKASSSCPQEPRYRKKGKGTGKKGGALPSRFRREGEGGKAAHTSLLSEKSR